MPFVATLRLIPVCIQSRRYKSLMAEANVDEQEMSEVLGHLPETVKEMMTEAEVGEHELFELLFHLPKEARLRIQFELPDGSDASSP